MGEEVRHGFSLVLVLVVHAQDAATATLPSPPPPASVSAPAPATATRRSLRCAAAYTLAAPPPRNLPLPHPQPPPPPPPCPCQDSRFPLSAIQLTCLEAVARSRWLGAIVADLAVSLGIAHRNFHYITKNLEGRRLVTRNPVVFSAHVGSHSTSNTTTSSVLHLTRFAPGIKLLPGQMFKASARVPCRAVSCRAQVHMCMGRCLAMLYSMCLREGKVRGGGAAGKGVA